MTCISVPFALLASLGLKEESSIIFFSRKKWCLGGKLLNLHLVVLVNPQRTQIYPSLESYPRDHVGASADEWDRETSHRAAVIIKNSYHLLALYFPLDTHSTHFYPSALLTLAKCLQIGSHFNPFYRSFKTSFHFHLI